MAPYELAVEIYRVLRELNALAAERGMNRRWTWIKGNRKRGRQHGLDCLDGSGTFSSGMIKMGETYQDMLASLQKMLEDLQNSR
jgi:hypothetical protein